MTALGFTVLPDVFCQGPSPQARGQGGLTARLVGPVSPGGVFPQRCTAQHECRAACECRCTRIWEYPRLDSQFNNYWPLSGDSWSSVAEPVSSGLELFYFPSL